jgi:uncharacterized membrane protein
MGPLAVCARCLGLYPVLLLVVVLEGALGRVPLTGRWFLAFALVSPAVIDWSRARLFGAPGTNAVRAVTGVLAGTGLGLAFSDYFRDSNQVYFWVLVATLAGVVLLVWRAGRGT